MSHRVDLSARSRACRVAFVLSIGFLSRLPSAEPGLLELTARSRRMENGFETVVEKTLRWKAGETAIVICDMWDRHWCEGASRRVAEMAPRMNRVVAEARSRGVFVVHAPSDTMDFYEGTSQRELARKAPRAANLPEGIDRWCSIEKDREGSLPIDDSDGGCDTGGSSYKAWTRQIAAIEVAAGDAVSDRGSEIWNLFEDRGIRNVILMGVHTNMCVLGRPFGIRSLVRNGKNVVLARDLTDSMYNPERPPHISHRRGTELVVAHIESHWCPSIEAGEIRGERRAPHVVFVIAEREYFTRDTLPAFAAETLVPRTGYRVSFRHVSPDDPWKVPGLDVLDDADLLVLSMRRRALPGADMDRIRRYLESGKPLVAIRTSSHAFATRGEVTKRDGFADWPEFDPEVLGGNYQGHHSNHGGEKATRVRALKNALGHPILRGVAEDELVAGSSLYKVLPLAEGTTVLMSGRVPGEETEQPVAWTYAYKGGRVFYTSLGHREDFAIEAFRRLLANGIAWALEREGPGWTE